MPSQIFNHTYSEWVKKKVIENGAATYSRDICKYHSESLLNIDGNNIISTCPEFSDIQKGHVVLSLRQQPDNVIQYLHTYPYEKAVEWACNFYNKVHIKPKNKIILVTAYKSLYLRLKQAFERRGMANSMDVAFIPMGIDTSVIPSPLEDKYGSKRVIYLGNVYPARLSLFNEVKICFEKQGWQFDFISKSKFNGKGKVLTQPQIWDIVNKYSCGVGVGRSAMEMMYMGLKVMICGQRFGGLISNEYDAILHLESNHGGRISTFDKSINACIESFDLSIIPANQDISNIDHANIIAESLYS